MENLKDLKYYQDLTFQTLDKLIQEECRKGNSKLYLSQYCVGEKMAIYLKEKGFDYFKSEYTNIKILSW